MSYKSVNKKAMIGVRTIRKTPIKITNCQTYGMPSQTLNTISFDEHKKVLNRNNTLARENAALKEQIRLLKNEIMALKANQVHNDNPNAYQMFDTFSVSLNVLSEEYNQIKDKFDDLGMNVENVRTILEGCRTQLNQSYPEFGVPAFERDERLDGFWVDNNGERHDCDGRNSMSSQERESRRRLSLERIKREFHVFSELSTILEQSREQRTSSIVCGRDSNQRYSGKYNDMTSLVPNGSKSSLKGRTSDVTTITEVDSDAENERQVSRENSLVIPELKVSQIYAQKRPLRDSSNSQPMRRSSLTPLGNNFSQVYDIHDKENVMPLVLPSNVSRFSLNVLNLVPPQHSSSPVEQTDNGSNGVKTVSSMTAMSFGDDSNYETNGNSSATVLVEETYSLLGQRLGPSLGGVRDTPQICVVSDCMERIRSDSEMVESEAVPNDHQIDVDLNVSKTVRTSIDTNKSKTMKTRAKRARRNSIRIICYDETSDKENNENDSEVVNNKTKKRRTAKPKKVTNCETEKSVVVNKTRKTRSQTKALTQQKKINESLMNTNDNLGQRMSVYDFEEDDNSKSNEIPVKSKRTKTKKVNK